MSIKSRGVFRNKHTETKQVSVYEGVASGVAASALLPDIKARHVRVAALDYGSVCPRLWISMP